MPTGAAPGARRFPQTDTPRAAVRRHTPAALRACDPPVPDWAGLSLPDTWPDRLDLRSPAGLWQLLRAFVGARRPLELPSQLPGREWLPKYLQLEFHHLPNGNYSKRITRGYLTGFDHVMLGSMRRARARVAGALQHCRAVLDVGSGGGRTAAALRKAGVAEVWGLDPSPYLLQHAARDHPDVRFVQGVAERTGFADARFDGVSACFLLHEIPPRYLGDCLREFNRVLKPGGLLALCEPSALQWRGAAGSLWRRHGLRGIYFHWLARLVYEPFVDAWHRGDIGAALRDAGFTVIADEQGVPVRHVLARKC